MNATHQASLLPGGDTFRPEAGKGVVRRNGGIYAGFTLVEIVLAIGILAVALVGILSITGAALDSTKETQESLRATQIAADVFEELRSVEIGPATTFPPRYFDDQAIPLPDAESASAIYRLQVETSSAPPRPGRIVLVARVTYPWLGSERAGQTTDHFTTLVFNPEPDPAS